MRFDEEWIDLDQLEVTAGLAASTNGLPGAAVEVGTWQGRSAIPIARAVAPGELHVVDHWRGDPGIDRQLSERDNFGIFLDNIREAGLSNVVVHRMSWQEFALEWDGPIRFVHIDGEHSQDEVAGNIAAFLPYAVEGAVFCGDDYWLPEVKGGVRMHFPDAVDGGRMWVQIVRR